MEKINRMAGITERSLWTEITEGGFVYGAGNSVFFNTGDWRTKAPVWRAENCKQCLLCFPVCPDSSIPAENSKRGDFDMFHCKGCGICAKVCPFGAIAMTTAGREEKEGAGHE
ncbi:MAG: 4Fe-4S binding protein [Clostridiales Family XIII bacterium]|nr:4Fe-4S binding protein [Clostridiales Family XIII bacterium]